MTNPYNTGPFREGDNGGIFGGNSGGADGDYESWDWKQIKAAIVGGSAVPPGADGNISSSDTAAMHSVANPQSFFDAANSFNNAQQRMLIVAESISQQARSLAGENGPWKGEAAKAFLNLMEKFALKVKNQAESIGGGDANINPIPGQLWNNGNQLIWAQNQINAIDVWYAQQAQNSGVDPMDNGLIPVSQRPEIVAMLTRDMKEVARHLTGQYKLTRDDVKPVDTSQFDGPGTGPPVPPPVLPPVPPPVPPPVTPPPVAPPPPVPPPGSAPPPGGTPPPGSTPPPTAFSSTPPPTGGGAGGGPAPTPFPGGGSGGAPSPFPGGGGPSASSFPGAGGPGGGSPTPTPFSGGAPAPTPFPGGGGPGGVNGPGGGGLPTPFVPTPAPGSSGPSANNIKAPTPKPFPGSGEGLPGLEKPAGGAPKPFPGSSALPNNLSTNAPTPPPVSGPQAPTDWASGGSPGGANMPENRGAGAPSGFPGSGMPGGANSGGGPERSDASGLLNGGTKPWTGTPPPGLGDPSGVDAPAKNPTDWSSPAQRSPQAFPGAGAGMPGGGMPGSPGASAAGGGSGAERSDASGLLNGGPKPWAGTPPPGLGDPNGVDAPATDPAEWATSNQRQAQGFPGAGSGMPGGGMPGSPGASAAAGGSGAERSDASGLLGNETKPWAGTDMPGMGDPNGVDAPATDPAEWASTNQQQAQGFRGAGMPPPGSPGSPGAGANAGGSGAERSDASGLLGNETKPWAGTDMPGMGDPSGVDAPATDPAEWASTNQQQAQALPGTGSPGAGMPGSPGAGANAGGSGAERSDASGLLGNETQPWTGSDVPGMGDPSGVDAPAKDPAEWASTNQAPGFLGMTPGMSPGSPGMPGSAAAAGGSGAERSDASGLLGNESDQWSGVETAGVGDPHGIDAPAADPAEWASPEQHQSQVPVMGATGSAMPGLPGANAAAGSGGAERSDASGLLGNETDPWAGAVPVVGDPTTVDAPAAEQAAWASTDQPAQVPDESTVDRVAVVKPSEQKEDTAAWDLVAGAGALAFLVPFAVAQAGKQKEQSEEELTPEYTLRETEPWGEDAAETELTTYRRKKGEEGTHIVEDRPPAMCTDELPPAPEPVETEEDSDEEEEEEPRTAANLLKQTDDAWGKSGTKPLGVLE
ncbi:hypothetical protein [Amycolatopsis sp.]|uniref:hypothetical protein n=1 Tax=Amycolatopsis sp. TaxID=37632 RepID=UPI002E0562F6|nr:hypothetical protein [Amycolatopsis sp.]